MNREPPRLSSERIAWMDGLRGIAVLLILVAHFFPRPAEGEFGTPLAYAHRATALSFSGIDLFFVLSGFFIGAILGRAPSTLPAAGNFYLRRVLRIAPLAWACAGITLFGLWLGYHDNFTLRSVTDSYPAWEYFAFVSNLRLAYNVGWEPGSPLAHFWTLGVEMQFYLAAPILFALLKRPMRVALVLVVIGLVSRLTLWAIEPAFALAFHFLPFCRADAFGLGVAAAACIFSPELSQALMRNRSWLKLVCIGCGGYMLWLLYIRPDFTGFPIAGAGYTLVAAFYASVIMLIATGSFPRIRDALCHPILLRFGAYSYFIYLFQDLAARLVSHLFAYLPGSSPELANFALLPLTTLILVAVAPLSWRLFESPLIRLGRRSTRCS